MMLRNVFLPAVFYDLVGLASDGVVSVGRESDSLVRLDSSDVPFLLSRKHATFQFQPSGGIVLKDLNSTNGTYTARAGQVLKKLHGAWELQPNDIVGFGGPDIIVASGAHVPNPFMFKYIPALEVDPEPSMDTQGNHLTASGPNTRQALQPQNTAAEEVRCGVCCTSMRAGENTSGNSLWPCMLVLINATHHPESMRMLSLRPLKIWLQPRSP